MALREPEIPPAVADLSVPAVSTAAAGIEDGVDLKDGEGATAGDLCKAEGLGEDAVRSDDGNAAVNAEVGDGNEAEDGDADDGGAEEFSSAEEGNDEEESIPDDDESSVSDDGENSIAEVEVHVR